MLITDIEKRTIFITQLENPLQRLKITGAERENMDGEVVLKKPKYKYNVKYTAMLLKALKSRYIKSTDKRFKKWEVVILKPGQSPYADKGNSSKKPSKTVVGKVKHIIRCRKFQGHNKMSWQGLTAQLKQKKGK